MKGYEVACCLWTHHETHVIAKIGKSYDSVQSCNSLHLKDKVLSKGSEISIFAKVVLAHCVLFN